MTGSTDATPTVLDRIDFGLRRVERWTALIAGAFVMVITAFGVAEVVMRKLFNAPIFGQIDFVAQSMVPVALLGMAYCQNLAGNVRMTLVIDRVGPQARRALELFATLIALILIAYVTYASFTQIDHAGRAYIALANFFRHTGLKADAPATVAAIASARVLERAKLLAAFFRVAYLFSAAMPGVIPDIGWRERADGAMELTLPESRRALIGDRVLGRIAQLAKVCGRRIDVAVV